MTQERRAVGTSLEQPYLSNQYGADGELLTLTDANNNLTANTYDGFDRLIQTNYPVATLAAAASNPADFEAYTYDPNDNRLTDRRRDGVTLTYGYDALKRVVSKSVPAGSGGPVVTRTAYDLQGHPLSVVYASTGTGITYSYDGVGRTLTEATNGYTLTYAYDADSNLLSMTWPDGQAQAFAYDSADHAISMGSAALPTTVGEQFTYDPAGRLTGVTRPNGFTTAITLDGASRLTGLAHGFSNATYNVAYGLTYTPAGQAASRSLSNASYLWPSSLAQNQTKAADGLNRDAAIAAVSGGYDPRGNLTFDGTRTFTYDEENRLTSETGPATASLGYDPLGRLTGTVINGATTNFLYSGSKLVAEYDGSGNLIRRYFHGEGVDSPDIWVEGPTVTATNANFLVKDRQGSVIAAVNSAGLQTAVYKYGPYGEPDSWGGSRFRYTGQIEIPELALYHYKARVYDPVAGRFLQTDPIGYKDGPDWYLYTHGDPINLADSLGTHAGPPEEEDRDEAEVEGEIERNERAQQRERLRDANRGYRLNDESSAAMTARQRHYSMIGRGNMRSNRSDSADAEDSPAATRLQYVISGARYIGSIRNGEGFQYEGSGGPAGAASAVRSLLGHSIEFQGRESIREGNSTLTVSVHESSGQGGGGEYQGAITVEVRISTTVSDSRIPVDTYVKIRYPDR